MSRTSSDGSINGSLGDSLGGSIGDQRSTTSTGSRRPRRSLDELLAMQRARETDFTGMPSLSSFRADEMSAVTSTSYTSFASNSRGGDSRGGDCDISLPSLSSFRLEDLSACSSYHSVQTNTNHLSDQSAEGWASFTSGNVSAETDSDDGKRRAKPSANGEIIGAPIKPSRSSSGGSLNGSPSQRVAGLPLGKGFIKRENSMTSNASAPKRSSTPGEVLPENRTPPMKRPTRTISPTPDDRRPSAGEEETPVDLTTSNARPPARTSSSGSDRPERHTVERTESFQLSLLQPHIQKDRSSSLSADSLRNSATDGSSSSLRGGDSLPRLPRRTNTVEDHGFPDEDGTGGFSDDASNLSDDDDVSTKISDDEVTRISDDDVSLNSDVESDITDTEHLSTGGDTSERIELETPPEPDTADGTTMEILKDESQAMPSFPETIEKEGGDVANAEEAIENPEDDESPTTPAVTPAPDESTQPDLENTIPEIVKSLTPDLETTSQPDADNTEPGTVGRATPETEKAADETEQINGSVDQNGQKRNSDESGTSAEESGTSTTDVELEDTADGQKHKREVENKRGKLLRKVSSSFRNMGKQASFRNSFRVIGKQASKLKLVGGRKHADVAKVPHEKLLDDPGSQDE